MKKIKIKEKTRKTLYSAAALSLCAAALFGFWMTNKNNTEEPPPPSDGQIITRPTENNPTEQANSPVTNIPDSRDNSETETENPQNSYFSLPLENGISKSFSNGEIVKNTTTDDWRTHNGADLPGVTGDPVRAINNGVVTEIYDDALWGTVAVVDHYNGITAKYMGLGRGSTAEKGAVLHTNDKIGNLGEIPVEKSDGVHLHLEIYKDGKAVSPADYIGKTITK